MIRCVFVRFRSASRIANSQLKICGNKLPYSRCHYTVGDRANMREICSPRRG